MLRVLVPLLILAAVVSLAGWEEALRYERTAVGAGEWWRLLSAQWVHLGVAHLLLNAGGMILLAWLAGPLRPGPGRSGQSGLCCLGFLVCVALGVGLGIHLGSAQIYWYVGLSGLAHGLAVWAVFVLARRDRWLAAILGVALVAKLTHEQWSAEAGLLPASGAGPGLGLGGAATVVDAHLYGALTAAGLLALSAVLARRRTTSQTEKN